jgi:hypothetical protein
MRDWLLNRREFIVGSGLSITDVLMLRFRKPKPRKGPQRRHPHGLLLLFAL